ncbi:hypothetical protein N7456_006504 [Penicillium angulare]|uniref:Uncharacterized protein n=1 Tax=Penicillium angulare TaxID=116970 RepID=A0A9W9FHU3_9EURO|nr:hypothetical protein N7456_006504 [Penicillium angulare]
MSDDEEYYEWEDEYLFEDPVPDLVDELAATSYYEAALFDDPNIYTEDYFSDWEYYTDDYYDDDPTVKESSLRAKTEPSTRKNRKTKVRRTLPLQHPPLHLDLGSFQGVVWKASLDDDPTVAGAVQIYEPGQSDKVALLEDWREIFKSAQPALDKSRLRKRHLPISVTGSVSGISGIEDEDGDEELGDDEGDGEEGEGDGDGDSSDAMSDVLSFDQTNESLDAGDVSNTTPELGQSPKDPGFAVEIPVKRGRKRKAETPVKKNTKTKASKPSVEGTRSRSKRVALDTSKSDDGGSTGPVRRSTRQKK